MSMLRVRTSITGAPGGPYLSTMYFTIPGAAANSDAAAATVAVRAFWDLVRPQMKSATGINIDPSVAVIDIATGDVTSVVVGTAYSTTGTEGSSALIPTSNQGLVKWSTGIFVGGREITGHTFVPCVTAVNNNAGVPGSGLVAAMNSAAAALIADASTTFAVWSRAHAQAAGVQGGSARSYFAVLRSRRD